MVPPEKHCYRGKMTGDQPVDDKEDEASCPMAAKTSLTTSTLNPGPGALSFRKSRIGALS
jgi:hypothetical protein